MNLLNLGTMFNDYLAFGFELKYIRCIITISINAIKLSTLEPTTPLMNMGQTRWYQKLKKDKTYIIALDPSMGTGGDYAEISL